MNFKTWTPLFIVLTITTIWLYDIFPFVDNQMYTISAVLNTYFFYRAHPLMTFLVGMAFGILINHWLGWGSVDPQLLKTELIECKDNPEKLDEMIKKLG